MKLWKFSLLWLIIRQGSSFVQFCTKELNEHDLKIYKERRGIKIGGKGKNIVCRLDDCECGK